MVPIDSGALLVNSSFLIRLLFRGELHAAEGIRQEKKF
jgi:hypothetical protein